MITERPTHPELVRALAKPGADILATLTPAKVNLWHAITGISGEAAELLEAVCAGLTNREGVKEESGDLYFYIEQLCQELQYSLNWEQIEKRALAIRATHPGTTEGLAVQIVVRAGVVLDLVKKHVIYNKELDLVQLEAALINLAAHIGAVGRLYFMHRDLTLNHNISKLSKRYEGLKYSDQAAQARKDKEEGK